MADPKTPPDVVADKVAPAAAAPPSAIVLNKHYAWFTPATKTTPSQFVERNKGDEITDSDEIAYFIGINADFTAA